MVHISKLLQLCAGGSEGRIVLRQLCSRILLGQAQRLGALRSFRLSCCQPLPQALDLILRLPSLIMTGAEETSDDACM